MEKQKAFVKKHREFALYALTGVGTTVINYGVFYLIYELLPGNFGLQAANAGGWAVSLIFAFFANKFLVFKQRGNGKKVLVKEFVSFAGARFVSLLTEGFSLFFFTTTLGWNAMIVKVCAGTLSILINYSFTKSAVFSKKPKQEPRAANPEKSADEKEG